MCDSHSTRTLESDDLQFIEENGRIYGNDTYYMPCDQAEQDRLTIQHQVFVNALKGKLSTTPLTADTRRVLDLCTGPGNWAVAVAQYLPQAEVVGVDMAVWDIETTEADGGSGRVTWEIDDLDIWGVEDEMDELTLRLEHYDPFADPTARNPPDTSAKARAAKGLQIDTDCNMQSESDTPYPTSPIFDPYKLEPPAQPGWHFSQPFDLIHLRNCKGTFAYWEEVYAEIYKNLTPGGWVEVCDFELVLPEMINSTGLEQGPGERIVYTEGAPLPTIRKLYLAMMEASFKSGRPLGTFYMHRTYLEDAGFKDVKTTYVNVPIGQWPEDPDQKKIGKMFLVVFYESLEAHLLRLLTHWGDKDHVWTVEEVHKEIEQGKREIMEWSDGPGGRESREGWCANFKWIIGRKSKNC